MLLLQYFQCHREEELDIVERKGIIINLPEGDGDVDFCYRAHHSPKDSEGLISNFQESFAEQSLAVEKCIRRDLSGGGIYTSGTVPPLGPVERKTSLTAACLEYCMVFGVFVFCGDGTQSNSISQMNTLY